MSTCEPLESRVLFSAGSIDHSFGNDGQIAATADYQPYGIAVGNGGRVIV